jgi:putative Ca2+/H+ antiporter (TMEM165/GDT1 family)
MGDRTQLLALILSARFQRPWPIVAGILIATVINHLLAALIGAHLGQLLTPRRIDLAVAISMLLMSAWSLRPDTLDETTESTASRGAFVTTLITFFIAEIGDKTQIATMALAAAYPALTLVIAGSTSGMLIANVPVVFLGKAFAGRLPLRAIRQITAIVFLLLALTFTRRAYL